MSLDSALLAASPPPPYIVSVKGTKTQEEVMLATGLPPAAELIGYAKAAMEQAGPLPANPASAVSMRRQAASKALDQWKPQIDQLTDMEGAAAFLGLAGADSVRRKRHRTRTDGTPEWPAEDKMFGRSPAWMFRTIVIHLAEAPGRGHPGMVRGPRKAKES
jgi:hypothetical protein